MPYEVRLVTEPGEGWPPRIVNTFTGKITTEEIISSIRLTLNLLDKQSQPTDLVAIFKDGASMLQAKGILFQKELIDQLTWHSMLDQIMAVDLNQAPYGSFLKMLLDAAVNQPALKVSLFTSMAEFEDYLTKKYASRKQTTESE